MTCTGCVSGSCRKYQNERLSRIVRKKDVERSNRITKPKRQTRPHLANKKCEIGIDNRTELC